VQQIAFINHFERSNEFGNGFGKYAGDLRRSAGPGRMEGTGGRMHLEGSHLVSKYGAIGCTLLIN